MWRRIRAAAAALWCVCCLLAGGGKAVVYATPASASADVFAGEVGLLRQDGSNYVMQVTVENRGEDFSGTVQVVFVGSGHGNCAYNTELALPAQGKKQFTINVTERAADSMRGLCAVNFLDGGGRLLQSIPLDNVFGSTVTGITMGILSDDFSSLTYLDAGGRDFSIRQMSYPLQLAELNEDNLKGYLDGLYFLVIDRFNVSSLKEESIQAIQDWVADGGWLLIGTGAYGEQTLSGFDEDFLGVSLTSVSEPGEENSASAEVGKYGYFYSDFMESGVDLTQMAVAELDYDKRGSLIESVERPGLFGSLGDGGVSVLRFSLGEKELQKLEDYMLHNMYREVMYASQSYDTMTSYSNVDYNGRRLLAFIDSLNVDVDFTWLEVLILVYVVLAGPVLYLVLKRCKKREWYWVGVPVMGLVFIAGVYFLGRGLRVSETRVYSLTAQQVDGNQADTYFLAYRSGVKEWDMLLAEGYETAGPGWDNSGWYSNYATAEEYYYVVNNDSRGLSVGIKPRQNFDSGFLYAGRKAESKGSFSGRELKLSYSDGVSAGGTVTNGTVCDLAYMGVWFNSQLMVFSDVKAGETFGLQQAVEDGRCVYQNSVVHYDSLLYDMVGIYGNGRNYPYQRDDIAVLCMGLSIAQEANPMKDQNAVVVGVVKDYDKAVAEKCEEISYGCLYSYVEVEVEDHASN